MLFKMGKLYTLAHVYFDKVGTKYFPNGTSFIIYDEIRFSKELLPMYFKHNNMASFVRQLNMYGFRKLSCIDQGGMHCFKNEIEFYHQYFIKGQEPLLELIKRKIPNSKSEEPKVKQEYIDELISNIKSLRGKQDSAEQGMRVLKKENRLLWRHVNLLTDRYAKQQAVLQQLLPFFMNVVRSSRSSNEIALKRKAPLMIDDGDIETKIPRMSPPYYVEHNEKDTCSAMPSSPGNVSNRGPVIHDVTDVESSKMFPANVLRSPNSTTTKECEAIVDSPLSCSLESPEQTIDSPYTDPGSMETLNILNHNFESHSNSISPHMEMKHSPINIANPPLQLQSHACVMPTITSPMSTYTAMPNGISGAPVIDETTSDVPISEGLMRSHFIKIEDSCDSGIYTMDSVMNNRVSSMMNESTSPLMNENTSSIMSEAASSMMNSGASSLMNGGASSVMNGITSSVMNGTSAMMNEAPSSMVSETASSMMNEAASSMIKEATSSMIKEATTSMMNEVASTLMNGASSSLINEKPSTITNDRMVSAMNEGPSTSSGNKFLPNTFAVNTKNAGSDMNWLLNQETYGSDPSIESWLGQIFKSDNLVAGCSLPQEHVERGFKDINHMQMQCNYLRNKILL
ncbi:heat shock factor protein-like isoform X2 [Stegodyphus dumicola]|uniref:heat shock factor protein-like isoform X2 n=1 Tax=Stegodyphus dumicola TaxID=202533 RepID=UPI0015AC4B40|nr:heat shock factor protein-like isoform X2 [Stegodyphus dumicola]